MTCAIVFLRRAGRAVGEKIVRAIRPQHANSGTGIEEYDRAG